MQLHDIIRKVICILYSELSKSKKDHKQPTKQTSNWPLLIRTHMGCLSVKANIYIFFSIFFFFLKKSFCEVCSTLCFQNSFTVVKDTSHTHKANLFSSKGRISFPLRIANLLAELLKSLYKDIVKSVAQHKLLQRNDGYQRPEQGPQTQRPPVKNWPQGGVCSWPCRVQSF